MARQYQETAGFYISEIARMMRMRFHHHARHLGLTRAQWMVLNRVSHNEGINQSRLAELLEVEIVTVSRLLESLEGMGWLVRRPDPKDRRAQQIYLTDRALPLLDQLDKAADLTDQDGLGVLTPEQLAELTNSLRLIRDRLSDLVKDKTVI
ncbi:MAG TPA: MarR family transcriptional regulator [Stellaceae bacterium]|nr:MarR family transcriptional regulator [Stellaceae bacterium]